VVLLGTIEEPWKKAKKSYIRQSIKDFKLDFVGTQETMREDYPANILK
jgi:hypothetical protein